jgi:hypothetical protein
MLSSLHSSFPVLRLTLACCRAPFLVAMIMRRPAKLQHLTAHNLTNVAHMLSFDQFTPSLRPFMSLYQNATGDLALGLRTAPENATTTLQDDVIALATAINLTAWIRTRAPRKTAAAMTTVVGVATTAALPVTEAVNVKAVAEAATAEEVVAADLAAEATEVAMEEVTECP